MKLSSYPRLVIMYLAADNDTLHTLSNIDL